MIFESKLRFAPFPLPRLASLKNSILGSGADVTLAIVVEFLSGADFAWKPLTKDDILAVAKLFGRNHRIPHSEAKMKHDFCYESWPWNTRAFGDHLNDPMWSRSRAFIEDYLSK